MKIIQKFDKFKLIEVLPDSIEASIIYEHFSNMPKEHHHRLFENYKTLDLSQYEKVFAIFDSDELVSFSCIQQFPQNHWRIATRLWTAPKYRSSNILPSSWNGKYLMPTQVKWIEDRGWSRPFVFWSREPPITNLSWTLKKVNRLPETVYNHVLLDGYYNTGKKYEYTKNIKNCWQKIICVRSPNFSTTCELPHITGDEYEQFFK